VSLSVDGDATQDGRYGERRKDRHRDHDGEQLRVNDAERAADAGDDDADLAAWDHPTATNLASAGPSDRAPSHAPASLVSTASAVTAARSRSVSASAKAERSISRPMKAKKHGGKNA